MIELNKNKRINFYGIKDQNEANPAYQHGMQLIKEGDWEYGFYLHELRSLPNLVSPQGVKSAFDKMPLWIPGMDVKGWNVVVWCEAGWGDMIQFSRFISLLKQTGIKQVKLAFPRPMIKLLRRLDNHDGFYDFSEPFPRAVRVKVMSLPYFLMEHGVIPAKPVEHIYGSAGIFRNPDVVKEATTKPRIGYCHTTTNQSWNRVAKMMPRDIMENFIKAHPEFEWVNLQQGGGVITSELWSDTADIVQKLDGVISVDSSIAHIAGSVGVPVANLIGQEKYSCWRWYPKGETTYWYDTMKTVWFKTWEEGLNNAVTHFKTEEICNAPNTGGNKRPTKTNTRRSTTGTTRGNE